MIRDERSKNNNNIIKGKFAFAGYKVDEPHVKEMLQFMGVRPTEDVIQDAIGYMSSNAMEINMTNLYNFIKERGLNKTRIDNRLKKN